MLYGASFTSDCDAFIASYNYTLLQQNPTLRAEAAAAVPAACKSALGLPCSATAPPARDYICTPDGVRKMNTVFEYAMNANTYPPSDMAAMKVNLSKVCSMDGPETATSCGKDAPLATS